MKRRGNISGTREIRIKLNILTREGQKSTHALTRDQQYKFISPYMGCLIQDDLIHKFVREIIMMTLPLLPAQHIQSMYVRTESLVLPNGNLCELINYVCQLWIEHPVFVPHCWTVYNITVRLSHNDSKPFWHGSVYFSGVTKSLFWECQWEGGGGGGAEPHLGEGARGRHRNYIFPITFIVHNQKSNGGRACNGSPMV